MTATHQTPSVFESGIQAHIGRVDLHLRRNGITADQRQEITESITAQAQDLLRQRCGDTTPTQDDIAAVLESLDPPESYTLDAPSTAGVLRILFQRFWIGLPVKLVVNDHGRRRVYWLRILGFFLLINLVMACGILPAAWLLGDWTIVTSWVTAGMVIMMNAAFAWTLYRKLGKAPVTDLPQAHA